MDRANAPRLAALSTQALEYVDRSPNQDPERGLAWLADPRGTDSHLYLLELSEPEDGEEPRAPRTQCHRQGSRDEQWQRIRDEVHTLSAFRATVLAEFDHYHVTLAAPEGTESDVC